MNNVLTEIQLVFENVDWVAIPAKYIMYLDIDGIKSRLRSNWQRALPKDLDEYTEPDVIDVFKNKIAEQVFFVVKKSAVNRIRTNYDTELFERLEKYKDITAVELKFSDGTEEKFLVRWEDVDSNGCANMWQESFFDEDGNLFVEIGDINDDFMRFDRNGNAIVENDDTAN